MQSLGNELMSVYGSLSFERQLSMIEKFREILNSETDERVNKFYAGIIEILEKEKKENV